MTEERRNKHTNVQTHPEADTKMRPYAHYITNVCVDGVEGLKNIMSEETSKVHVRKCVM